MHRRFRRLDSRVTSKTSYASDMKSSNKAKAAKVFGCEREKETAGKDILNKLRRVDLAEQEWVDKIPDCPVFCPSEQEFEDPLVYLQKIVHESQKYGICKIVSPINASIPAAVVLMKEIENFKFETIVQPLQFSEWNEDNETIYSLRGRKYTYRDFETLANKAFLSRFYSSGSLPSPYVEKLFWHEMEHGEIGTVEYGVNVEGSAFSCDPDDKLGKSKWNLKNFSRLQKSTLRFIDREIPGITDPMLYIGMLFSMFAWHVEDHYLYSINYHHSGANKTWYGVPSYAASQFEEVTSDHVFHNKILSKHDGEAGAFQALAHKTTMFSPNVLIQHGVPVYKVLQKPGEFVITFPRAYHAGFSHGFNCGEAVNFAVSDWFPFGAEATRRYAHLGKMPIIPFEELLCNEAMLIYKAPNFRGSSDKFDLQSDHATKLSFMQLMQFYYGALSRLEISSEFLSSSNSLGTVVCSLCSRDCYVAFFLCKNCYTHPICLFHEIETQTCLCGRPCTLFKRDEMLALIDAATSFELEKDIMLEFQRNSGVNVLSKTFFYIDQESIRDNKNNLYHEERITGGTVSSMERASSSKIREEDSIELNLEYNKELVLKICGKRGPPTMIDEKGAQMKSKLQRKYSNFTQITQTESSSA
ncbi:lysine-specific demethylase JMJ13-like [Prosopis cineraria]|uniref:lysine-specific demethylase JMJ13-like n=1 Tax=Prosopis cineraria TaxID=364024 RepID=UPI00240FACD1|nr:lysine-specific demethylase JMJ13-like [Prosopis cineraria]